MRSLTLPVAMASRFSPSPVRTNKARSSGFGNALSSALCNCSNSGPVSLVRLSCMAHLRGLVWLCYDDSPVWSHSTPVSIALPFERFQLTRRPVHVHQSSESYQRHEH